MMFASEVKKLADMLGSDVDVDELPSLGSHDLTRDYEKIYRHDFDGTYDNYSDTASLEGRGLIEVVESWILADRDGDGIDEWRHVFTSGTTLLSDEEWFGQLPFFSFTYFPVPHKFYGLGVWNKLRTYQLTATGIIRAEIVTRLQQITPRWLVDPRFVDINSLQSGRPGPIITRPGFDPAQVLPLDAPAGANNSLQILDFIHQRVIAEIGIDPVSGQISADVEKSGNDAAKTAMVIDNASAKIEGYCREFAENCYVASLGRYCNSS